MDDLIAFLKDRIAEDETAIRTWAACCVHIDACDETGGYLERFDERRMLAEVEAKRKLIELYLMTYETSTLDSDAWTVMKDAMRTLTQPYANHPDYRPEWRS